MKSNKLGELTSLNSASARWKEKLVRSEETYEVGSRSRGKVFCKSSRRATCLPAPVPLSQLLLLSSSRELRAHPPVVALRQEGMRWKGNPVFHNLLHPGSFGLLRGLGPRPGQHSRPTRMCVSVSDCYGRWEVRERSTVGKENFPDERNLSDEVLHIPAILIGLDPLSC